jgi:hypothetical protein
MTFSAGTTYRDKHNSRRRVALVTSGAVTYELPISLRRETVPLAEFEAWSVGEFVGPEDR